MISMLLFNPGQTLDEKYCESLRSESGYEVNICSDVDQLLTTFQQQQYDILFLVASDLEAEIGKKLLSVCSTVRQSKQKTQILILSDTESLVIKSPFFTIPVDDWWNLDMSVTETLMRLKMRETSKQNLCTDCEQQLTELSNSADLVAILEQQKDLIFEMALGINDTLMNKVSSIDMNMQLLEMAVQNSGDEEDAITYGQIKEEVEKVAEILHTFRDSTDTVLMTQTQPVDWNDLVQTATADIPIQDGILWQPLEVPMTVIASQAIVKSIQVALENSIEATEDFSVSPIVIDHSIESRKGQSMSCLKITDQGCGMDEKTLSKAIIPFYSTKGSVKSGLGLWYAKQAVEYCGGDFQVHSIIDKGTTVNIYLPISNLEPVCLLEAAGTGDTQESADEEIDDFDDLF